MAIGGVELQKFALHSVCSNQLGSAAMPQSVIYDPPYPTFSTIRWPIDSLAWRLNETGGPKRLESGIYVFDAIATRASTDPFCFSIGLSTRADDVNSLNWFIRRIHVGNEVYFPCTFWLEAADRTPLCDRQGS